MTLRYVEYRFVPSDGQPSSTAFPYPILSSSPLTQTAAS